MVAERIIPVEPSSKSNHPDWTWPRLLEGLPQAERDLRFVLPYRIGITWRPDGGWGDYVHLEALYDLVAYVADAVGGVDESVLARYRQAHHCSGYYLLVVDRIADGQVFEDEALRADRVWLAEQLLVSLTHACGDEALAQSVLDDEMERWRVAVDRERAAFAAGQLEPSDYAEIVFGKVAPLWMAPSLLLRCHGADDELVGRVRRWFELIMLALQLNDDAADVDEDQRLQEQASSLLLDYPPDVLRFAALGVLRVAARATEQQGNDLAAVCDRLASAVRIRSRGSSGLALALGAEALQLAWSATLDLNRLS